MIKQNSYVLVLFILACTFISANSNAWQDKVDASVLEAFEEENLVDYILLLDEQADVSAAKNKRTKTEKGNYIYTTLTEHARRSQETLIAYLEQSNVEHQSFWVVNAIRVKSDKTVLEYLAKQGLVKSIDPNPWVQLEMPERSLVSSRSPSAIEWGINAINADDVWGMGYNGQGIVIGGQDTGYDWSHPALEQKYKGYDGGAGEHNYNWHDAIHELNPLNGGGMNPCGLDTQEPCDDGSHGTHTMGTMVGDDGAGNQIGVAPGATWIACRCMERGWGTPTTYMECFQWFIAPTDLNDANADPAMAPHVINNSWGCPEIEGCNTGNFNMMETVVDNVKAAGIVVVVSAGNSGSECETVSNPAAIFESSFTIGATDSDDNIAGFSSRGPVSSDGSNRLKPNVAAPGVFVRSCTPGPDYAAYSGTSMAGPHVAGAVALILSAYPALIGDVEGVESILEATANQLTDTLNCGIYSGMSIPNAVYGHGRIDVLAAVDSLLSIPTSLSDLEVKGLKIYPNPFEDFLLLDLEESEGAATLELYNSAGQLVMENKLVTGTTIELKMDLLPSGVYLYKLKTAKGIQSGKLSKIR